MPYFMRGPREAFPPPSYIPCIPGSWQRARRWVQAIATFVCALPRDIDVRHIALTSATHRAHSAHVDAMRDVLTQQATQINELAQHNHNSIISFQKRTRQNA